MARDAAGLPKRQMTKWGRPYFQLGAIMLYEKAFFSEEKNQKTFES